PPTVPPRAGRGPRDHDPHGLAPAVVDVALDVDGEALAELWLRTVTGAVG
ncbi:nucleoside hydrolase, partial [Phycicoccus sp. CSK15P-2]|nr:nucleoside hydrolase [Phycicoccus sp. CSK15P-2]